MGKGSGISYKKVEETIPKGEGENHGRAGWNNALKNRECGARILDDSESKREKETGIGRKRVK